MENIEDIVHFTFEYGKNLKIEIEKKEIVADNKIEDMPFYELFEFCKPFILKEMIREKSENKLGSKKNRNGEGFIDFSLEIMENI